MLIGTGCDDVEDRVEERLGRADVDLPEDAGRDTEDVVVHRDVHCAGLMLDTAAEHQADVGREGRNTG